MMGFWDAVASAGPYANNLHLAPDRKPHQHLITQKFTGRMLFLTPNQQRQSIEGQKMERLVCMIYISWEVHGTAPQDLAKDND